MSTPMEMLREAARDEWSDPVETAARAVGGLLTLCEADWPETGLPAVRMLRSRRPDQALMLAATEPALDPDPVRSRAGLEDILGRLRDTGWTTDLGLRVAHHASLGVASLGRSTLAVLESAAHLGGSHAELYTDSRAIAKGLGYLHLPISVAPPEEAAALLAPAAAACGKRIWTTARIADAALRARAADREVVVVCHPLAELSPLNRASYRPRSTLIDVKL
jgi:hypothetical protein